MSKEVFRRDTPIIKELSWLCPDASLDETKGCATSRDGVTRDLNLSGWGMRRLPVSIGRARCAEDSRLNQLFESHGATEHDRRARCASDASIRRVREPARLLERR